MNLPDRFIIMTSRDCSACVDGSFRRQYPTHFADVFVNRITRRVKRVLWLADDLWASLFADEWMYCIMMLTSTSHVSNLSKESKKLLSCRETHNTVQQSPLSYRLLYVCSCYLTWALYIYKEPLLDRTSRPRLAPHDQQKSLQAQKFILQTC